MQDYESHGGWWKVKEFKHVTGPVAIEFNNCYVKTLDNGGFTLGAPKEGGAGPPDPEEVLLAVKITDTKVELNLFWRFPLDPIYTEVGETLSFSKNAEFFHKKLSFSNIS